ncbi:hypothetical protein G647_04551 [Cladophialophora carrionii CBS 160.54]|uniref:Mediator of RNA polymerase II transcription subunit 1 n=1 Tax=Cladophialophora carrionii CBS 160.54 TaxID=1279043 RepID=V9DFS5_9EURO|nr:uncharacterized protein G647_04551 [Cladophialophora carrionii CBS 160.54]ETI25178.1 hypothetical protein G647_04551 [Cladophialophora carrionii CBS 160.54]
MATPTRSQTVSTPKPHLSTPNRLMASPRPGTSGNSSRPLAYKSPAVKTPASLHGHHVSVSSQPSSTPLAGTAVHDDLLALNSPAAALMNSLGTTGLTPLGSAADGLGITTHIPGGPARTTAAPVNPEVERLHRAQLVVETLKRGVGGHGITREGVERIAQLQGFTTLWDDDNLTIAGNCVDLEVNFEAGGRDNVRDVSLKLNISETVTETEEPQFQAQGTQVIKDNLHGVTIVNGVSQWRSLDAFASNLQYLSQLDRIETGSPCFNAVGNLYQTFRQIWDAEKARFQGRSPWQHLRQSAVGRPVIDRKPRLGLALDYWTSSQRPGQPPNAAGRDEVDEGANLYTAHISCEAGLPSTAVMEKWLSDGILVEDTSSMLNSEAVKPRPDWRMPAHDPEALLAKPDSDGTAMEKPTDNSSNILDLHFYCDLGPEVYLPLNVAANLNVEITMVNIDQESTLTYQAALHKQADARDVDGNGSASAERWLRCLPLSDATNPDCPRKHSYALHSAQSATALWCFPVRHLNFTHPKQIAAALPIFRQYVVLWRMLQSLVEYAGQGETIGSGQGAPKGGSSDAHARPLKRTNKKAPDFQVEDLLQLTNVPSAEEPLPIDLTLDVLSDISKAKLDLYVPLVRSYSRQQKSSFIFLSLCICQDGVIEVRDLRGLPSSLGDSSNIQSKVIRVLEATEDIGLTVEWLLEQASAHS